jgi:hypothetical protein
MGLLERFEAKVQQTDDHWWWTGATQKSGHGTIWNGAYTKAGHPQAVRAHRVSYELYVGPIPAGREVEHACHQPRCVNPAHLRIATHQQNLANRGNLQRNNSTGVRGVVVDRRTGRFRPSVKVNGRFRYRGSYATLEEATAVAEKMRQEYFPWSTPKRE